MQIIRLEVCRITNASLPEYDKHFRLKTSANSSISWASVDAELCFWGLGTSLVKIDILQDYLALYPDKDTTMLLSSGFSTGFFFI